jgi:hypothetical protein
MNPDIVLKLKVDTEPAQKMVAFIRKGLQELIHWFVYVETRDKLIEKRVWRKEGD